MFHQICGRLIMCIIILFTIVALLYHVVIRYQSGRVRQTFSLQARRVNVVVIRDDHSRATGNQTNDGAGPVQVGRDDSNGAGDQMAIINDVIRNGLLDVFMQRHIVEEMEGSSGINLGNEYEESDEENIIGEDNSPSYQNTVKSKESSSDEEM